MNHTDNPSIIPQTEATRGQSSQGLTASQVKRANDSLHGISLDFQCSDHECHPGANEFELVQVQPLES